MNKTDKTSTENRVDCFWTNETLRLSYGTYRFKADDITFIGVNSQNQPVIWIKENPIILEAAESNIEYFLHEYDRWSRGDNPHVAFNDQRIKRLEKALRTLGRAGLYFLDGVSLPEELWKQIVSRSMSFDEILAIQDADVRAVALKYNKNAIIASGAELIDEHPQFGELFLIEKQKINQILSEKSLYFLRMKCPTGRTFVEAVDPAFAKKYPYAMNCQAHAFGVPVNIYSHLQARNEG